MDLTKTQELAIKAVIRRLRNEARVSGKIDAALNDEMVQIYLDSWVTGALEALVSGDAKLALSLADYNWKSEEEICASIAKRYPGETAQSVAAIRGARKAA